MKCSRSAWRIAVSCKLGCPGKLEEEQGPTHGSIPLIFAIECRRTWEGGLRKLCRTRGAAWLFHGTFSNPKLCSQTRQARCPQQISVSPWVHNLRTSFQIPHCFCLAAISRPQLQPRPEPRRHGGKKFGKRRRVGSRHCRLKSHGSSCCGAAGRLSILLSEWVVCC